MSEIKHILCPVDFSDFSRRALDHAVAIARLYGARITALHVFSVAPGLVPFAAPEIAQPFTLSPADREQVLRAVTSFVGSETRSAVPVDVLLTEASPVHVEILAQANALQADLIVIGTHGRSGFDHLVLGSVTEKLLRKTAVPVLAVPRGVPDAVPAGPGLYRHVLCATDFSQCSLAGLSLAVSLAKESKGSLTVVHVIELPAEISEPLGPGPFAFADIQRELELDAEQHFRASVSDAMRAACDIQTVVAVGKPYQEILRIAAERASDLIVAGVHGRGVVDRMLFGSTTNHLVRQATCPVLTLCSRSESALVA